MNSWEGINEFVAVAELQSFTAAATKLGTSVANVSRRINALEARLAVKLLVRTTRRVTVTELGECYYQHCKPLVEGLTLAGLAVTQLQSTPSGVIKMTAPVTFGEHVLAPLIHQFLQLQPKIDLELVLSNQNLDLVQEGFDLAIRLGKLDDSTMMARKLLDRQTYVCCSPGYLQQYGEPHTLSELKRHHCLRGSVKYWRFTQDGKEKQINVEGRIRCNSGYALTDAALKGLGIVQLPDYYVQPYLESGQLVELLSDYRVDREGIWAVYPQNRMLTAKIRTLIDYLYEALNQNAS
ncbi:LysR family transcriptional regulator [Vibrio sp.]|uniref:LysR family transcriptional regulator n=1 Tax=Vibrio sp. TaxID=678 RepID=UPI003D0BEBE9